MNGKPIHIGVALVRVVGLICAIPTLVLAAQPVVTPRTSDGRPDLNGLWENGGGIDFVKPTKSEDGSICVRDCGVPPTPRQPQDRPKYQPQFEAKVKDLTAKQVQLDPGLRCGAPGVPRIGPPDKIVQTNREVVFLYEDITGAAFRVVTLGGKHVAEDIEENAFGHSIGSWDGDTLVVDTIGFSDDTWLGDHGLFHTTQLHVVERFKRTGDALEYDVTVEDPGVLAEAWRLRKRVLTFSNAELPPAVPCNEQDLSQVVDGTYHDNLR
jgi:hypothetical protein